MNIVVTFRSKDDTQVIGTFKDRHAAIQGAREFLKGLSVDEEELGDELGEGWTWEEAVQKWGDFTDGYEEFIFSNDKPRRSP